MYILTGRFAASFDYFSFSTFPSGRAVLPQFKSQQFKPKLQLPAASFTLLSHLALDEGWIVVPKLTTAVTTYKCEKSRHAQGASFYLGANLRNLTESVELTSTIAALFLSL